MEVLSGLETALKYRGARKQQISHHIDKFNVLRKAFLQGNTHDQLLNIITQSRNSISTSVKSTCLG